MTLTRFASAALIAALAWGGPAAGQTTTLRVANWLPPTHPLVQDILKVWIADVEKATQGRVKPQLLEAPLGPPPAHFDFAVNGVADVTYGVHNYTTGRFPTSELAELPFLSDSARDLSVAYWRVYEKHLAKANDQRGVKILTLFTHGPGAIYTSRRVVKAIDDFKGLKIRVGGGVAQEVGRALGVVPVQAPSTQAYELLAQGVADGIQFPAESIAFFNLQNVVKNGVLFPGGLYTASFFIVMNQAKWNGLPEQDKQAILSVSGEKLARIAGEAWDKADARGREAMKAAGVVEAPASEDLAASVRQALEPVVAKTLAAIEARGVDAKAAYQMIKDEVAASKAGR